MVEKERRTKYPNGRRKTDELVCPFHKLQCSAIQKNAAAIEKHVDAAATREEVKDLKEDIKSRAPKWVLTFFISSVVGLGILILSMLWDHIEKSNVALTDIRKTVTILDTNQKILMRALDINPVYQPPKKEDQNEKN